MRTFIFDRAHTRRVTTLSPNFSSSSVNREMKKVRAVERESSNECLCIGMVACGVIDTRKSCAFCWKEKVVFQHQIVFQRQSKGKGENWPNSLTDD